MADTKWVGVSMKRNWPQLIVIEIKCGYMRLHYVRRTVIGCPPSSSRETLIIRPSTLTPVGLVLLSAR